jgi:hypothetical protein
LIEFQQLSSDCCLWAISAASRRLPTTRPLRRDSDTPPTEWCEPPALLIKPSHRQPATSTGPGSALTRATSRHSEEARTREWPQDLQAARAQESHVACARAAPPGSWLCPGVRVAEAGSGDSSLPTRWPAPGTARVFRCTTYVRNACARRANLDRVAIELSVRSAEPQCSDRRLREPTPARNRP